MVACGSACHRERHHAIPLRDLAAMLMSAKLGLPKQVFGHGWIFVNGQRMSKSLGNVVDPAEAAERFGTDPLRLYLVKEVPYGGDGDFTWERLGGMYNADLANNLGI